MAKKGKSRLEKLGKLGVAILEHKVTDVIGEDAIDILKASYKEHETLITALAHTEQRFRDEYGDKELVKAMFDDLSLENLPSLEEAFSKFYSRPTDPALPKTLTALMRSDFSTLAQERLEKAVSSYIEFFTEELAMQDEKFRDNVVALASLRRSTEFASLTDAIKSLFEQVSPQISTDVPLRPLHQLPPPPADFTGREAELAELREALTGGGVTISGVRGMGGIGKTVLALELCQGLKDEYPDAQIYLDLRGASEQIPLTPAEALSQVLRAYHPTAQLPEEETQLRALYLSTLEGQRALLLMDNVLDKAQVELLLPPPGCCLLVTSRQRFTLPGLKALDLDRMTDEEAQTLLLTIAPRIGEAADEIAELCDHLPYALRLVATALAETANLTPDDYMRRHREEGVGLEPVEVSLKLSYDLLDEALQERWRALAVFPGGFDLLAAIAVWIGWDEVTKLGDENQQEAERDKAQETLGELLRYSLLEWGETTGRYRLHDLERAYAARLLEETEGDVYQLRHAEHYRRVLNAADYLYQEGGEGVLVGLALYDREAGNITAGQAWAAGYMERDETIARLACDYPDAGAYVIYLRLHALERIRWLETALVAARRLGDRKSEGGRLGNLGQAYAALGETHRAIEFFEQELDIAHEIGDRRGEGTSLSNLGNAYYFLGETRRAIEYYEQDLDITRETGNRRGEGGTLGNLGNAYAALGETRRAIEFYEQVFEIARETGDLSGVGKAIGRLGQAYAALGEIRRAIEYYEQDLEVTRKIGDRRGEGAALCNLGNAYADLGETRRAIEYYEQDLDITRETGDRRGEGVALGNLGSAYAVLGETRRAIEFYEQDLDIARETGNRNGEGSALGNLGLAHAALSETRRAIELHEQALEVMQETGNKRAEGVILGNLGNAYAALGETRRAIELYEQCLEIARETGDRRGEGYTLWNLAVNLDKLGEQEHTISNAAAALEIFEQIEDPNVEMVRNKLAEWQGEG